MHLTVNANKEKGQEQLNVRRCSGFKLPKRASEGTTLKNNYSRRNDYGRNIGRMIGYNPTCERLHHGGFRYLILLLA